MKRSESVALYEVMMTPISSYLKKAAIEVIRIRARERRLDRYRCFVRAFSFDRYAATMWKVEHAISHYTAEKYGGRVDQYDRRRHSTDIIDVDGYDYDMRCLNPFQFYDDGGIGWAAITQID